MSAEKRLPRVIPWSAGSCFIGCVRLEDALCDVSLFGVRRLGEPPEQAPSGDRLFYSDAEGQ